ncbi:MAG: aldo/keto reductase, partial [Limnochordia bacterium]
LYAGVSMWTAAQIEEAVAIADRYLLDRIIVNQPAYNMLDRTIEAEIIPVSEKYGIGQIVFSPLAQGLLTGKYRGGNIPAGSRGANPEINRWIQEMIDSGQVAKADALQDLAEELGISLVEMALAWILRQPNVASALVGATRPEQIEANVKAVEVELSEDTLAKIGEILA